MAERNLFDNLGGATSPGDELETDLDTVKMTRDEYVEQREVHFARAVREVLRLSGVPIEKSAELARTIQEVHNEAWEMAKELEVHPASRAIKDWQESELGSPIELMALKYAIDGAIPDLQATPQKPGQ
jgi:hypothetical protein